MCNLFSEMIDEVHFLPKVRCISNIDLFSGIIIVSASSACGIIYHFSCHAVKYLFSIHNFKEMDLFCKTPLFYITNESLQNHAITSHKNAEKIFSGRWESKEWNISSLRGHDYVRLVNINYVQINGWWEKNHVFILSKMWRIQFFKHIISKSIMEECDTICFV